MAVDALMGAGVAVNGIASLISLYLQERARGAEEDRINQIREELKAVLPPEYDSALYAPPEVLQNLISDPQFQTKMQDVKFTPQALQLVGEYKPEIAQYIAEKQPELIRDTQTGLEGLSAQREALTKLREIGRTGYDPAMQAKLQLASRQAQAQAQSRQQSLLQDMARRGTLGSGIGASLQQQAGTAQMENLANMGQQAAIESYRNQLQSMRDAATLGGTMRGQELDIQSKNAGIINDFNQRATANYQNWLNMKAAQQNEAQLANLQARQDIANRNVEGQNKAQMYNIEQGADAERYRNLLEEKRYATQTEQQARQNEQARQNWLDVQAARQDQANRAQQNYQNQLGRITAQGQMSTYPLQQQQAQNLGTFGATLGGGLTSLGEYGQKQTELENERRKLEEERQLRLQKYGKGY